MLVMFCVISGRIVFSRVLIMGDRREIGLYAILSPRFLLGLGIEFFFASFHMCGNVFVFIARLYNLVSYSIDLVPGCLRR